MSCNDDIDMADMANEALASMAMEVDEDPLTTLSERVEAVEETPLVASENVKEIILRRMKC